MTRGTRSANIAILSLTCAWPAKSWPNKQPDHGNSLHNTLFWRTMKSYWTRGILHGEYDRRCGFLDNTIEGSNITSHNLKVMLNGQDHASAAPLRRLRCRQEQQAEFLAGP